MTDVNEWIRERRRIHDAATGGPWYKTPNDRIKTQGVQWPEGDDYDIAGCAGNEGVVIETSRARDGHAIVDAHNTLPAVLTAIEKVLELHVSETGGTPDGGIADVCSCGQSYWPCATVRAIEGAINE